MNNYQPRAPHPGRTAVEPCHTTVHATSCNTQSTPGEGMRIGEVLGLRISDFVMGRGGTPYVEIVPRLDNPNGARVKLMRPRRVYVGSDLERLFADYLTQLACRAATLGVAVTAASPLLVNLQRPPFLGALGAGTVRDKTTALRKKGIGPPDWTPHWFRHSHATTLLLAGTPDWVVSRRLGHAHLQTTLDLYGWVREDEALRAAANWPFVAANPVEARGLLGSSPWEHVTEAHPASWFRQVSRIPHQSTLNDRHYVDDHALAQIPAALPLLGLAHEEQLAIT